MVNLRWVNRGNNMSKKSLSVSAIAILGLSMGVPTTPYGTIWSVGFQ